MKKKITDKEKTARPASKKKAYKSPALERHAPIHKVGLGVSAG